MWGPPVHWQKNVTMTTIETVSMTCVVWSIVNISDDDWKWKHSKTTNLHQKKCPTTQCCLCVPSWCATCDWLIDHVTDPPGYAQQRRDTQTETAMSLHSSQAHTMHNSQEFRSAAYTTRVLHHEGETHHSRRTAMLATSSPIQGPPREPPPHWAPLLFKTHNTNDTNIRDIWTPL